MFAFKTAVGLHTLLMRCRRPYALRHGGQIMFSSRTVIAVELVSFASPDNRRPIQACMPSLVLLDT